MADRPKDGKKKKINPDVVGKPSPSEAPQQQRMAKSGKKFTIMGAVDQARATLCNIEAEFTKINIGDKTYSRNGVMRRPGGCCSCCKEDGRNRTFNSADGDDSIRFSIPPPSCCNSNCSCTTNETYKDVLHVYTGKTLSGVLQEVGQVTCTPMCLKGCLCCKQDDYHRTCCCIPEQADKMDDISMRVLDGAGTVHYTIRRQDEATCLDTCHPCPLLSAGTLALVCCCFTPCLRKLPNIKYCKCGSGDTPCPLCPFPGCRQCPPTCDCSLKGLCPCCACLFGQCECSLTALCPCCSCGCTPKAFCPCCPCLCPATWECPPKCDGCRCQCPCPCPCLCGPYWECGCPPKGPCCPSLCGAGGGCDCSLQALCPCLCLCCPCLCSSTKCLGLLASKLETGQWSTPPPGAPDEAVTVRSKALAHSLGFGKSIIAECEATFDQETDMNRLMAFSSVVYWEMLREDPVSNMWQTKTRQAYEGLAAKKPARRKAKAVDGNGKGGEGNGKGGPEDSGSDLDDDDKGFVLRWTVQKDDKGKRQHVKGQDAWRMYRGLCPRK